MYYGVEECIVLIAQILNMQLLKSHAIGPRIQFNYGLEY
jgi:hypothetical protein